MPEPQPPKSAYNSRPYKDAALAAAQTQSLTPEQVMEMGYYEIAALAGVKIEPNGNSPASFVYAAIRGYVASRLRAELRAIFWEGIRAYTETEVRKEPGMAQASVIMMGAGDFQVLIDGKAVAVRSVF